MSENIIKRHLDNGIPLLMEPLGHLRSVSLGIWVETGSRDENPDENGISHFLEHVFFKGTPTRTALQIAEQMDATGGEINAFTSREQTAFYIKALSDRIGESADLLLDIFTAATFPEEELDREKQVVVEEIRMLEDEPEEWVHDLHTAHVWGADTPLGRNILGTEQSVRALNREGIRTYLARRYTPDRIVVSAAGGFDPDELFTQVNAAMGRLPEEKGENGSDPVPDMAARGAVLYPKKLEQVHMCVGGRGLAHGHPDRFGMYVLNNLLGGGSSSRLFQEIREKRGLAYSVYSGLSAYRDCGEVTVYAGCGPESAEQTAALIVKEIDRMCETPVTAAELSRAKGHLTGMVVMGLEGTFSRMSRLAQDEFQYGQSQPIDTILEGINRVDAEAVQRLARHAFAAPYMRATLLGAIDSVPDVFSGDMSAIS